MSFHIGPLIKNVNKFDHKEHVSIACMSTMCKEQDVAHGAMGRRIDPSWGGPIELFLVPASAP